LKSNGDAKIVPTMGELSSVSQDATYKMQIVKTTDGGNTWTSQFFSDSLPLYFNGIDCYDAEHCCAAAEGDYVAVYCTADGENWE